MIPTCSAAGCDAVATWSVSAVAEWIRTVGIAVCDEHRDALLAAASPTLDVSVIPW
jgi:hypothetical protein